MLSTDDNNSLLVKLILYYYIHGLDCVILINWYTQPLLLFKVN